MATLGALVVTIVPASRAGLLCDSTSPSGLSLLCSIAPVYVLRLGCSDGEVVRYL